MRRWVRLLAACGLLFLVQLTGSLAFVDNALSSLRMSMVQRSDTGTLAVVAIDAPSLAKAGHWPWSRERYARVIANLRAAGAQTVAFDVDFSASSDPINDQALESAIADNAGWIVLPTFVQGDGQYENAPMAMLARNAVVGSVNILPDADGRVRQYARGFNHADHYRPTIAAVLAHTGYREHSLFHVDFGIQHAAIPKLSFDSVLQNSFDPALVRGRNILLGSTAEELGDAYPTPVAARMPGVMIHALAYESLIQGRALFELSRGVMLGVGLIALLLLWPQSGPLNIKRVFVRHAAVFSAALLGPLALQLAAPVSANTGIVFVAQVLCVFETIRHELAQRTMEISHNRETYLRHIALHDPETNLPNRRAMQEQLDEMHASQPARAVLVIAVGIDRFHTLRGAIGHLRANDLMRKLAERIAELDPSVTVYHLSTSILGVLINLEDPADANNLWRVRLEALDTCLRVGDQDIDISIRAGMAAREIASEKALESATIGLDQARIKKTFCVIDQLEPALDPKLQLALVNGVRRGLHAGDFAVVYQPKVSVRTSEVIGAEALVRWRHPNFGEISPTIFVPTAEETGAILQLTRWILARVIADQQSLLHRGVVLPIAVNLSARLLCDPGFCEEIVRVVRGASASIIIEITETAMLDNPSVALAGIDTLRSGGIAISIDDYGAGMSSLGYLKQIPADELKIDRSLILDITTSARDRLILGSTVDLAHSLGMKVVAEGVEDEATALILTGLGCDVLQGYHLGAPMPLEDFSVMCGRARLSVAS